MKKSKSGTGILDTIFAILREATEDDPVSKDEILEIIKDLFPDIKSERLRKTIADACGYWAKKRGLGIKRNSLKEYWIESEGALDLPF